MIRREARAASARRGGRAVLAWIGLWLNLAGSAFAGDRALIDVLGFSPDARYFAFEEYGIADGSGFAYSTIYLVDLKTDSWVVGTPIRIQASDEEHQLVTVREEAARSAAFHLRDFKVTQPAETLALIGDGETGQTGKSITFGLPGYAPGEVHENYNLQLRSYETPASTTCSDWFDAAPLGFELTLSDADNDYVVHRDETLPRSRGCPFDYRIYAVVAPMLSSDIKTGVAIISSYPGGFEGPDRRFLAVPLAH